MDCSTARRTTAAAPAAAVLAALLAVGAAGPASGATEPAGAPARLVSVDRTGGPGDARSDLADLSANGRFVVFVSSASDLVPGDTNATSDVFVRDLADGTTSRVSLSSSGAQGNASSTTASISADGRHVAFVSHAGNLVRGDTNGTRDVFVRDRLAGTTTRVSVSSSEGQASGVSLDPSISADGRHVAFFSQSRLTPEAPGFSVYVRDTAAGTTRLASVGNGGQRLDQTAVNPSLSGNGRFVTFTTLSAAAVQGDTNRRYDVFVRDLAAGRTERVSVDSAERQASGNSGLSSNLDAVEPVSISADGRFVAFPSGADDLVAGDVNNNGNVYLRDRQAGTTSRVSVSDADTVVRYAASGASISANGRYVAFEADSGVVFLRDLQARTTRRVSQTPAGERPDGYSQAPSVSSSGRVAFVSDATDLVRGDDNSRRDVFVVG